MPRLGAFFERTAKGHTPAAETIARIKAWARGSRAEGDDTAFVVNEIACADPACPGIETVILVMQPGHRTAAAKIAKALADVTEEDVRDALAAAKP